MAAAQVQAPASRQRPAEMPHHLSAPPTLMPLAHPPTLTPSPPPPPQLLHGQYNTQAALSWWDVVSPFSGIGSTAALAFVVGVSAMKVRAGACAVYVRYVHAVHPGVACARKSAWRQLLAWMQACGSRGRCAADSVAPMWGCMHVHRGLWSGCISTCM